jgi:sugar phosphate isomerase/epimerase
MLLSTSNWICQKTDEAGRNRTHLEMLGDLKTAGFDSVDINLWPLCYPGAPLALDSWEEAVEAIRAASEQLGLPVYQTHGNTMGGTEWDDPSYPHRELQHITTLRCAKAAKRLGANCMVLHPFNLAHAPLYSTVENKKACIAYLSPYIEEAKKAGVRIAVENMIDFGRRHRRYCAGDIHELIDLVDTINDPDVGICIDTGHANISGMNAGEAIRAAGKRLFALHINDNHSKLGQDEHLLPYFGDVDWKGVMRALVEVGYAGHLTYEVGPQQVPYALRDAWLRYTDEVGRSLIELAK